MVNRPPGSAEYLSSLLDRRDEIDSLGSRRCMHSDTRQKERPARLGFFSSNPNAIDPCRITWIDTEVLCDHCYEKAVPQGFVVWSCTYNAIRGGDDYYPTRECFPPMVRAGCEEKPNVPACHIIEGIPIPDTKVVHMLWDRIQEDGRPFYIDLLHMYPPYDKAATDKDAEARRVFHANALAYRNAARGYSGLYANGGKHSLVEQRMLRNRQALDAEKWLSTRTGVSEEPLDSFYNNLMKEISPNRSWPFDFPLPRMNIINHLERAVDGEYYGGPTLSEQQRRDAAENLIREQWQWGELELGLRAARTICMRVSLAYVMQLNGKWEEAKSHMLKTIEDVGRGEMELDHKKSLCIASLGAMCEIQAEYPGPGDDVDALKKEANETWDRILVPLTFIFGEDHLMVLTYVELRKLKRIAAAHWTEEQDEEWPGPEEEHQGISRRTEFKSGVLRKWD